MKNYALYTHTPVGTVRALLEFCAAVHGEKTAFVYRCGKAEASVSFRDFKAQTDALGTYLFGMGANGKHVAVFGENSYAWILTHFAVTCGGNAVVPIDRDLDADGVADQLADSESAVLVYSETYADIAAAVKERLPDIVDISMRDIEACTEQGKGLLAAGYTAYIDKTVAGNTLATIVYTSGTTGKSKGVMLTHGNLMADLYAASCSVKLGGASVLLLPLHHAFGLVAGLYSVMYYGYPLYISKSLKRIAEDLKRAEPQNLFVVPLIAEALYKSIWSAAKKQGRDRVLRMLIRVSGILRGIGIDLRRRLFRSVLDGVGGRLSVIICGGAPLDPTLVRGFDAFGITLINGYGITECAPIVAVNRNRFNLVGSAGLPLCCNEVKIAPDGEILVKGENVMRGYYRNAAETEKAFADGWFKTGDIGSLDKYGALHITGRIKNLIILANGENIPAESLEARIYTLPYVKEVVCRGAENTILAEVYLDDAVADARERVERDIQDINRQLPQRCNIGRVIVRDCAFPKTTTKKIKRYTKGEENA